MALPMSFFHPSSTLLAIISQSVISIMAIRLPFTLSPRFMSTIRRVHSDTSSTLPKKITIYTQKLPLLRNASNHVKNACICLLPFCMFCSFSGERRLLYHIPVKSKWTNYEQ